LVQSTSFPFSSSSLILIPPFSFSSSRNHGSHFEKHRAAFLEGAANDDAVIDDDDADVVARRGGARARAGENGTADQPDSGRDSGSVVDEKNEKVWKFEMMAFWIFGFSVIYAFLMIFFFFVFVS